MFLLMFTAILFIVYCLFTCCWCSKCCLKSRCLLKIFSSVNYQKLPKQTLRCVISFIKFKLLHVIKLTSLLFLICSPACLIFCALCFYCEEPRIKMNLYSLKLYLQHLLFIYYVLILSGLQTESAATLWLLFSVSCVCLAGVLVLVLSCRLQGVCVCDGPAALQPRPGILRLLPPGCPQR